MNTAEIDQARIFDITGRDIIVMMELGKVLEYFKGV